MSLNEKLRAEKLRKEIDAAIARIDAKVAAGSDQEPVEKRRDLEAKRADQDHHTESGLDLPAG